MNINFIFKETSYSFYEQFPNSLVSFLFGLVFPKGGIDVQEYRFVTCFFFFYSCCLSELYMIILHFDIFKTICKYSYVKIDKLENYLYPVLDLVKGLRL